MKNQKVQWEFKTIEKSDLIPVAKIFCNFEKETLEDSKNQIKDILSCPSNSCLLTIKKIKFSYEVLGFIIYKASLDHFKILNISVNCKFSRAGVGSGLLSRIINKLHMPDSNRYFIEAKVEETNLPTQLFFKKNKFIAKQIKTGQSVSYLFKYHIEQKKIGFLINY